jgi:hypothetical protein
MGLPAPSQVTAENNGEGALMEKREGRFISWSVALTNASGKLRYGWFVEASCGNRMAGCCCSGFWDICFAACDRRRR